MQLKTQTNQSDMDHRVQYYTSNRMQKLLQELPFSYIPITSANSLQYFRIDCASNNEAAFDFLKSLKLNNSTTFQFITNEDKEDNNNKNTGLTLIFENDDICGILDNITQPILNIISFKLDSDIFNIIEYKCKPRKTFLQSPNFNIHSEMPINRVITIEVLPNFYLSCLYSTDNNITFKNFVDLFGNDKNVTIHFCNDFVSFCSSNKLLLFPSLKSQSQPNQIKFCSNQISIIINQIKNCKIFIVSPDDLNHSLNLFPTELFLSFAIQQEITLLQDKISTYSSELFTRNFTYDASQAMTYSKYFYLTGKTVIGYYLLSHPEYESTNPVFVLSKKILKHYINSSNHIDSTALLNLGLIYSKGLGVARDDQKAFNFLIQSANCGNAQALHEIGLLYLKSGHQQKALPFFQKAAKKGVPKAIYNLALLHERSDVSKAIELLELAARANDSDALFKLGVMHSDGHGLKEDKEKAVELYKKSCRLGNPLAHFNLAITIKNNTKKTIAHFFYAASRGVTKAQYNLACIFANGDKDVPMDKEKAAKLFILAAASGDSDAQLNLGAMFSKGEGGLEVNFKAAIDLYDQAAKKKNPRALFNLGCIYSRQGNQQAAAYYYRMASELNMPKATFNLGVIYFNGAEGVPQDKAMAAKLFEKVADANPRALCNLAIMYQNGDGVAKDEKKASSIFYSLGQMYSEGRGVVSCQDKEKANEYFRRAAELGNEKAQVKLGLKKEKSVTFQSNIENVPQNQSDDIKSKKMRSLIKQAKSGNPNAQYLLGACYAVGQGVPQDKKMSFTYYSLAANQGDKMAQFATATCYSYGKGTDVDKAKAFNLYLKAAKQGLDKAQFAVGHFYEYGKGGVKRNVQEAHEWYQKAAEQGNRNAIKALESDSFQSVK